MAVALVVLLVGTSSALAQELTNCMECHDDTTLITGKQTGLSMAVHGTGDAFVRGTRASCAGCHSGGAFSAMVAEGLQPNQVEVGDPNPTRQDCRACHAVHTSYTTADWALETTEPVVLYAFDDITFEGGKGNLCANCHQPRRTIAAPDADGNIAVTSTHWGPHHGPQSAMLMGMGGAGNVVSSGSMHYRIVGDTCVSCHIGADGSHSFEAVDASCSPCHDEEFDAGASQAAVQELVTQLHDLLEAKGLYHDGHPVVGTYPAAEAEALWNYIFIAVEDGSLGAHHPGYTMDLLEASIAALQ